MAISRAALVDMLQVGLFALFEQDYSRSQREAKQKGHTLYYPQKTCKNMHHWSARKLNGHCVRCSQDKQRLNNPQEKNDARALPGVHRARVDGQDGLDV